MSGVVTSTTDACATSTSSPSSELSAAANAVEPRLPRSWSTLPPMAMASDTSASVWSAMAT